MQPAARNAIREKLLQCLNGEGLQNVRNKIGDAVAEVARQYTDEGQYRLTASDHIARVRITSCR